MYRWRPQEARIFGQHDEGADRLLREPKLTESLLEARPLRGAADEAYIGELALQGRCRDRHVEGVVVGHDQDERVRAGLGDFRLRVPHAHRLRVRREVGGKGIIPVVEPAHGERQGRERQHQRPAHMAGAEKENRRSDLAMSLAPAGPAVIAYGGGEIAPHAALLHPAFQLEQPASRLRFDEWREVFHIACVESLDQNLHPAAAALAEIGAERLIDDPGRAAANS
ncbi:MAG: hypothetical protein K0Q60_3837 [Microvirga sp.]|nr:hypothetical protein [Microvirga sp.]